MGKTSEKGKEEKKRRRREEKKKKRREEKKKKKRERERESVTSYCGSRRQPERDSEDESEKRESAHSEPLA